MENTLTFKDVYKPPFKVALNGMRIQSSNHITTFTAFSDIAQAYLVKIVDILNGEPLAVKYGKFNKNDVSIKDSTKIVIKRPQGSDAVILVRGWGMLIGSGGFNLDIETATKIQDDFVNWVVDSITEEKEKGVGSFPTA